MNESVESKIDRIADPEKRKKAEAKLADQEYKKAMKAQMRGGKKMTMKK